MLRLPGLRKHLWLSCEDNLQPRTVLSCRVFTALGLSTAHAGIVQAEHLWKATERKVSCGTSWGWQGLPFRGINCPGQGSVQFSPGGVVPKTQ